MSKFIAAPRPLDAMMARPTLYDLSAHPEFQRYVDLTALGAYDPRNVHHQVLADVISEGVYRHFLIQEELAKEGASVPTDPLILRFQPGLSRTTVSFGANGGRNAGVVVFDREAGGVPSTFRPGGWLMKFKDIQELEDAAVAMRAKRRSAVGVPTDPRYAAVDDSDLFSETRVGFRQARPVAMP